MEEESENWDYESNEKWLEQNDDEEIW